MGPIGWPELLVILAIALVLFGAGKLPDIGKSLGKAISNFKSGMKEGQEESADKKLGNSAREKEKI